MIFVDELIPLLHNRLALVEPITTFAGRTLTRQMLIDNDAHALFVRSTTPVNADLLRGTNVRFVGTASVGTDHVDLNWLAYQDIEFASAPGSNAWAVVEYVYAWMLVLGYQPSATVGIVGHGNIGMRLEGVLLSAGYHTIVYDPPKLGHTKQVLSTLLETADVVSLHVPLTHGGMHATHGMIGETEISRMKQSSTLIQASRGGVLTDAALMHAVQSNRVTAVLDVYETEPNVARELVEVVTHCTPHIAGHSIDAKLRGASMIVDAYLAFIAGQRVGEIGGTATSAYSLQPNKVSAQSSLVLRDVVAEAQWFRSEYLQDPSAITFDALRKAYKPQPEMLRIQLDVDA